MNTSPTTARTGRREIIARRPLISYYLLTCTLSWLLWTPLVLSSDGLGILRFRFPEFLGDTTLLGILPGAYLGPIFSAFLVTAITEGADGLRRWRSRLLRWRVNWRWYVLAVVGVPAIDVAGTMLVPGAAGNLRAPSMVALALYLPALLFQMLTSGLAEEPGWRDFALPRHQARQGPLVGTLVLGLLWAVWHLPLFLTSWRKTPDDLLPLTITLFTIGCLGIGTVITWVFNRTGGSLPIAVLLHASSNNVVSVMLPTMFPTLSGQDLLAGDTIGFTIAAAALLIATRGRLGYARS